MNFKYSFPSLAFRSWFKNRCISFIAPFKHLVQHLCKALESLPYQYESTKKFLGLPLLSINLGFDNPGGKIRCTRGVFAVGNLATGIIAFGIFYARGIFTIALTSLGLVTVSIASAGLLSVSTFGVGVISVSVFAVGYVAVGILAVGDKCVGIAAFGYEIVGIIGIGRLSRTLFTP